MGGHLAPGSSPREKLLLPAATQAETPMQVKVEGPTVNPPAPTPGQVEHRLWAQPR